jgi:hypothetical protein
MTDLSAAENELVNNLQTRLAPERVDSRQSFEDSRSLQQLAQSFTVADWRQAASYSSSHNTESDQRFSITENPDSFELAVSPKLIAKMDAKVNQTYELAAFSSSAVTVFAGRLLSLGPMARVAILGASTALWMWADSAGREENHQLAHLSISKNNLSNFDKLSKQIM